MQSGYTPVAGVEVPFVTKDDLTLMATAWLRLLGSEVEGLEHQHARRVIIRLVRMFEDQQLEQLIDAAPTVSQWDGFAMALEEELMRRKVPMVWAPAGGLEQAAGQSNN